MGEDCLPQYCENSAEQLGDPSTKSEKLPHQPSSEPNGTEFKSLPHLQNQNSVLTYQGLHGSARSRKCKSEYRVVLGRKLGMKSARFDRRENATYAEASPVSLLKPANDSVELLGQRVGNYVLERHLASGGMAEVFVARHPELGRKVAVKLLSAELAAELDLNQRFLQEAQITANLKHPGIVEIYDLGKIRGRSYYTMELMQGCDLHEHLQTRGKLSVEHARDYLSQIASALQAAHDLEIVHRDLKPANIFVLEGSPTRLKLMDFGIAKLRDTRRAVGTMTGQILGTPTHMSPEQAMGLVDRISKCSDVYSLGVIAYEMLSGQLPFTADADFLLMTMHVRDPVPPLLELVPNLQPALAELVEDCLAKEPQDRPQSAGEFLKRLHDKRSTVSAGVAEATIAEAPAPMAEPTAERANSKRSARKKPSEPAKKKAPPPKSVKQVVSVRPEPPPVVETPVVEAPLARASPSEAPSSQPPPLLSEVLDDDPTEEGTVSLSTGEDAALDRILRRMKTRADFPSFLTNISEISTKADVDRGFSARQVSGAILKDFALTAKLLRMANLVYPDRFGGKVYSVQGAVVILGFDSVRAMALGVSVFKMPGSTGGKKKGSRNEQKVCKGPFHKELAESAVNSMVAGELARELAPRAGVLNVEMAMMCGMFRNLGRQLTMEYLPDQYRKLLTLTETEGMSVSLASQKVFGTSLQKLAVGIAERWCLPETMRIAISTETAPDHELVKESERLSSLAKFVTDFCHIIATGRRAQWEASVERLLSHHVHLFSLNKKEINGLLGLVCKSFETRYATIFGPYSRKSRFLSNARDITGEEAPPEPKPPEPLTEDERFQLSKDLAKLTQGLEEKHEPVELLKYALNALNQGLASKRVLLFVASSDRQKMNVHSAIGDEADTFTGRLEVPLTRGTDVFSLAFRNGRPLVIEDALSSRNMRRVPQCYYEVLGSSTFALYPCVNRGYRTVLLLVDAESTALLPPDERLSATKELREVLVKIVERAAA